MAGHASAWAAVGAANWRSNQAATAGWNRDLGLGKDLGLKDLGLKDLGLKDLGLKELGFMGQQECEARRPGRAVPADPCE
jgi:hypothetical protein